ncbi:hypothetical protein F4779DRAFT_277372 [Xylariaceae sp. FL0662B]|nr:hypothetical protein F4779DRAFT_277372 [Xylariaceae sp. FL0662B]
MLSLPAFVSIFASLSIALDTDRHSLQIPLTIDSSSEAPVASPWPLNFSSIAPYLFSSVNALLQQWGNTFFPNGHSIVACEIPPYTLVYHGRLDGELPPSPEWLAFDLEMSYGIMGSSPNSHMLTYQTTRPVKALYFDGESAALMGLGQLDTQMLHVFGNVSGPDSPNGFRGLYDEYARAHGLCDWLRRSGLRGPGWGFEGVIRMNAGFELIWCNFTSPSLRLLTHLNITAPQPPNLDENITYKGEGFAEAKDIETTYYTLPPTPTRTDSSTDPSRPPMPPNWRSGWEPDREPFLKSQGWGWFTSATNHYGSLRNGPAGETRAKVLNCGILSYYSPIYANLTHSRTKEEQDHLNLTADGFWAGEGPTGNRTVALKTLLHRRRYHHLENATTEEAEMMRDASERALRNILEGNNDCSGADWVQMVNEIARNMAFHLQEMNLGISAFPQEGLNQSSIRSWVYDLRAQSHMFLVGFLEYPSTTDPPVWDVNSDLFRETYSRCRYRYTRLMAPRQGVPLSVEEKDLRWAVEETFGTICSVLLTIGFGIEQNWAEYFNKPVNGKVADMASDNIKKHFSDLRSRWENGIDELMAWLGWVDVFTGCTEVCAWDERCYIPMWPLIGWGRGPPRRPPGNGTWPGPHYPPYRGPSDRPNSNYTDVRPPRGRSPSWIMFGEADLWEPKCVKASYFMRGA